MKAVALCTKHLELKLDAAIKVVWCSLMDGRAPAKLLSMFVKPFDYKSSQLIRSRCRALITFLNNLSSSLESIVLPRKAFTLPVLLQHFHFGIYITRLRNQLILAAVCSSCPKCLSQQMLDAPRTCPSPPSEDQTLHANSTFQRCRSSVKLKHVRGFNLHPVINTASTDLLSWWVDHLTHRDLTGGTSPSQMRGRL